MSKLTEKKLGRPRRITELPCYDSIIMASNATRIPEAAFSKAIREGCACKHHGRIDLGEFLAWWFKDPEEDDSESNIDWKRRGERAEALLKELKLQKDRDAVLDIDDAIRFMNKFGGMFFYELERLQREFPGTLVGRTAIDIRKEVEDQMVKVSNTLKREIDAWKKKKS